MGFFYLLSFCVVLSFFWTLTFLLLNAIIGYHRWHTLTCHIFSNLVHKISNVFTDIKKESAKLLLCCLTFSLLPASLNPNGPSHWIICPCLHYMNCGLAGLVLFAVLWQYASCEMRNLAFFVFVLIFTEMSGGKMKCDFRKCEAEVRLWILQLDNLWC